MTSSSVPAGCLWRDSVPQFAQLTAGYSADVSSRQLETFCFMLPPDNEPRAPHQEVARHRHSSELYDRADEARRAAVEQVERCARILRVITGQAGREPPKPHDLSPVPVHELFTILVEAHGLGVRDAVEALAVELHLAGYPDTTQAVAPDDAMTFTQRILARLGRDPER